MIQLKINNMDHKAILTVPAEYERVVLALWTIGLDRDPEKYTIWQLDAEFTYTTEEESQMVRLIDPRSSLMNALCFLSEMVYPPYPVAERIHKKMVAGGYASEDDFFIEMEKLVFDQNLDTQVFHFPISGEVVNKRGLVRKASDSLLLKYEHIGDREDIWYATNIEIYDYIAAYSQLVFSMDHKKVYREMWQA